MGLGWSRSLHARVRGGIEGCLGLPQNINIVIISTKCRNNVGTVKSIAFKFSFTKIVSSADAYRELILFWSGPKRK